MPPSFPISPSPLVSGLQCAIREKLLLPAATDHEDPMRLMWRDPTGRTLHLQACPRLAFLLALALALALALSLPLRQDGRDLQDALAAADRAHAPMLLRVTLGGATYGSLATPEDHILSGVDKAVMGVGGLVLGGAAVAAAMWWMKPR